MRATVTLRNSATFTGRGGIPWRKGQSRDLTDAGAIKYYKGQAEFVVTDRPDAVKADEPEPETPPTFTEGELKRLNKGDLVELAARGFGLVLSDEKTQKEMIADILEAQEQAAGQGG